ncbi:MAG: Cna B-type domain-containing protein [Clostridia bacterium]|nr:Cna B-type domain-containing protein [Clostridia bacterium]
MNGTYHPTTRKLTVSIKQDNDDSTTVNEWYFSKDRELKVKISARQTGNLPAPGTTAQYTHLNHVDVKVKKNDTVADYGSDDFNLKLQLSTPKRLSKTDMNWQEGTTNINSYNPNGFGWVVRLNPDTAYDQVVVTDTLPEGLNLSKIEVGNTVVVPTIDADGNMLFAIQNSQYESGLSIKPAYDPASRQLTITLDPEQGASSADLKGLGKALDIKYFFTIPETDLPSADHPNKELTYTNHASVDFVLNNTPSPETAEQTQKLNLTYVPAVTKYGVNMYNQDNADSFSIENSTGKLVWKVKVHQHEEYESITVQDTLPVDVIEPDFTNTAGIVQLPGQQYWLQVDHWSEDQNLCTLKFVNPNYTPDVLANGSTATYNASTGEISITLSGDYWPNNNVFGKDKDLWFTFYCKVKEDSMPNNKDGEYSKQLGEVSNTVSVTSNLGSLGTDTHVQNVTITQTKPDVETVMKQSPVYDDKGRLLHYQIDINPTQMDLDPEKNSITLIDKASYSPSDPVQYDVDGSRLSAERKLTLLPETVKLYYAQYDENGDPLMQGNRLLIGEEVDLTQWKFIYTEDDSSDWATRTMHLVVPDGRALILVYDYLVSMNINSAYYNVPLGINNSVYVEKYESDQKNVATDSTIKWTSAGGGGVMDEERMTLIKHDASNQAYGLAGVVFKLSAYQNGTWTELQEYTTDANGQIIINPPDDEPSDTGVQMNTLYRMEEAFTITGYDKPNPAPVRYFYWAEDDASVIACPENFDLTAVPNLMTDTQVFYVENVRKSTEQQVQKLWEYSDGTQVESEYLPSSVTAVLRRYAIPVSQWDALVQQTGGKINGALEDPTEVNTSVTIIIQDAGKRNSISQTATAKVGSTLVFDVCVSNAGRHTPAYDKGEFEPYFTGYSATHSYREGFDWYRFTVPDVKENMVIAGGFRNIYYSNDWDGTFNIYNQYTGKTENCLEITNIKATVAMPPDHSTYVADLQEYIDRDYSVPIKLNAAGNWKGIWEDLHLEGEVPGVGKVHYKYYVTETPSNGYSNRVTGYSSDDGGTFVITNLKDGSRTMTTNLLVQKEWYDSNGVQYLYQGMDTNGYERWQLNDALYAYKDGQWYTVAGDSYTAFNGDTSNLPLPSVSVRLLRKNLLVSDAAWEPYIYNENDHTVINGNTGWMCKFINLPMALYDQNNDLKESYDYFIEELEQGDFTVELVSSGTETENGKTFEVIKVKNAAIRDVSVSVEKKWENDQIPENASVTLELSRWIVTKDGYELDETFAEEAKDRWETTINLPTDANLWSYQWKDLPNGDTADGVTKSYSYRVTETAVNGTPVAQTPYEVVYSQAEGRVPADGTLTITNKQAANETQIKVTKVWEDAAGNPVSDLPDDASVTLKLMRRTGENGTPEAVEGYQAVTLDGSTNWQTTISGLPMYLTDTNGTQTAYVYYFVEESVPAGYMVSYSNSKDGIVFSAPENGEVTVTNTATTVVSAEKVWKNSDGSDMEPPETNIQLQLYKVAMNQADWQQYVDGLQQSETPETPADPVVPEGQVMLTFALDSKNVVFGNLFYTCAIGEEPTVRITYNGSAEVQYMDLNLAGGTYVGSPGNSIEIPLKAADTQESHTITVKVSCTDPACVIDDWSISPVSSTSYALRSSGTFTPPPGTAIAVGDPVTLPDQDSWRYQWSDMASKAGDIYYAYYVGEITVPGYETAYDASYDQETGAYSFTVTNTKSEEVEDVFTTTELTIQKVWVNAADYKPDSITFQVTQTDTSNPDANAVNYPVVVNLTGETPVASCQALTDLGVVMELTPSTDGTDSWTLKLTNLPDTMREDGVLRYDYSYTVTENPVSGFESVRTGDETTGNYTFTNTLTALIVQKEWVGEEGEAVQFNLWRRKGGEATGTTCSGGCSTSVNASDEHKLLCGHYICQLSNYVESEHSVCECGYSYVCQNGHSDCGAAAGTVSMNVVVEFNNSNATTTYELNVGDRIIWMMRAPVKNYHPTEPTATYGSQTINFTIEGGVNAYDVDKDGFVEYISEPFEVLSAENGGTSLVYKAGFWNDDLLANAMLHEFIPAQQSTRSSMTPNSIDTTNAELYTGSPFTLSAATGWTYLFSGLDAVASDGSPYQYFVEEVKVPDGYTVSYSHTDGISPDGGMLTITNIQNDEPDPVYLTVSKKWLDSDGKEMANQPQFYTVNYEIWAKQEQGEDTLFTQGQLPKEEQWSATYEVQPGESYYVKETGVLSGGNDMSALYEITYQAGENQGSVTAEEVAIAGGGSLIITNKLKPTYVLPETGGTGTYLYTGAGALLIGMALVLLYRNNQRKRRANE